MILGLEDSSEVPLSVRGRVQPVAKSVGALELYIRKHPFSRVYNGFTGRERARGAQWGRWADMVGLRTRAYKLPCSVCWRGAAEGARVQYHNENYYEPWTAKTICGSCHKILHQRFYKHAEFYGLQRSVRDVADEWFLALTHKQVDVAAQVRESCAVVEDPRDIWAYMDALGLRPGHIALPSFTNLIPLED